MKLRSLFLATTIIAAATGGAFAQSGGGGVNQPAAGAGNDMQSPNNQIEGTHSSRSMTHGTTGSSVGIDNPARDSAKKNANPGTQDPSNGAEEEK